MNRRLEDQMGLQVLRRVCSGSYFFFFEAFLTAFLAGAFFAAFFAGMRVTSFNYYQLKLHPS